MINNITIINSSTLTITAIGPTLESLPPSDRLAVSDGRTVVVTKVGGATPLVVTMVTSLVVNDIIAGVDVISA